MSFLKQLAGKFLSEDRLEGDQGLLEGRPPRPYSSRSFSDSFLMLPR
jgi:hypothetical protein